MSELGVVVIGRNEGERLVRCLKSVASIGAKVVYVDSGSTDGSVEQAQALDAHVVALDMSVPFTAARARNAGFSRVLELEPTVEYVQFLDGDCEVVPGWLETALATLRANKDAAAVCGRVRERQREQSIYNRLCDIEWDAPAGDVKACGGNAMMRASCFSKVGGFNPALIAGEEPELCVRLRAEGHRIVRLGSDMVLHDAAMTRFSQWWRRTVRAGHAYAEGAFMHGKAPERHWVRESRSIQAWGLVLPLVTFALLWPTRGWSLLLLGLYLVLGLRIANRMRPRLSPRDAGLYAFFCVLGKFPQTWGQLEFLFSRIAGKRKRVIDWREAGKGSSKISAA